MKPAEATAGAGARKPKRKPRTGKEGKDGASTLGDDDGLEEDGEEEADVEAAWAGASDAFDDAACVKWPPSVQLVFLCPPPSTHPSHVSMKSAAIVYTTRFVYSNACLCHAACCSLSVLLNQVLLLGGWCAEEDGYGGGGGRGGGS